ncbi:MAG: hypothetical protein BWK80_54125 [Desulfobacteraceae bacterium IS3]|nr:MAG: hypothetical protein BWK80_54125 [Desulfobacteraceae bacterium IS3]
MSDDVNTGGAVADDDENFCSKETENEILARIRSLDNFVNGNSHNLQDDEVLQMRELYGKDFLTKKYYLTEFEVLNAE